MAAGTPRAGLLAEFATSEAMEAAVARLRDDGYRRLDSFSPYELEEVEGALGAENPAVPWWGLAAAVAGAAVGYGVQWYANAWDYPLVVGGRPLRSIPAWVPITFETMVLFAAVAVFVGLWAQARLPALWHPVFEAEGFERASVDRFWVMVGADDPRYHPDATTALLRERGAARVVRVGGDG